jgi:hypothetical protein
MRETISMLANISLQAAFLPSRGCRKMPHYSLRTPPDTANDVPMYRIRARMLVGEALHRSRAAQQVYCFVSINLVLCYCELERVVIPPVIFVYAIGLMAQRGIHPLKSHSESSAPAGPTSRRGLHKMGLPWRLLGVAGLPKSWKRVPQQLYRHAIPVPLLFTPCVLAPSPLRVRTLRRW